MTAQRAENVFLLGLGGSGMSAIAHYLLDLNVCVHGWDDRHGPNIDALVARGAVLSKEIANSIDIMVVSDAVPETHPMITAARAQGITIKRRAIFLNSLAKAKHSIFVAGSHGKSTTSAMIAHVLSQYDPTTSYILGASLRQKNTPFGRANGVGKTLVAEACEAFGNIRHYTPNIAVLTNLTDDHAEHYGGQQALKAEFNALISQVTVEGTVILNGDCQHFAPNVNQSTGSIITYGLNVENEWSAQNIIHHWDGSKFDVVHNGRNLGEIYIKQPGRHMVQNALACIAACDALQLPLDEIKSGLASFAGVNGRWGDVSMGQGPRIIDDFANHPKELATNLETIKSIAGNGERVITLFQPQTYSRTQTRTAEFAAALKQSDMVFLLDLDPKGETPRAPHTKHAVMDQIAKQLDTCFQFDNVQDLIQAVSEDLTPNDIVYVAGAGDIKIAAKSLTAQYSEDYDLCQRHLANHITIPSDAMETPHIGNVAASILTASEQMPNAIAVVCGAQSLTYGELGAASADLASKLFSSGVQTGDVVAIGFLPSTDLICAIVAVLRMGCSCLLLDETLPRARLASMLDASEASVLLTYGSCKLCLDEFHIKTLLLADVLSLEPSKKAPAETHVPSAKTAFITFTSGTTGQPKGIATGHNALIEMLTGAIQQLSIDAGCRLGSVSSLSFDAAISDMLLALTSGATLIYPHQRGPIVGADLANFIHDQQISHILATPSVWRTLPVRSFPNLRVIMTGGEKIEIHEIERLATMAKVFNIYGPAEAAIFSTIWAFEKGVPVSIGRTLPHVALHLLNADTCRVQQGEVGEICLSGGICHSYLGRNATQTDRFTVLRTHHTDDQIVFKTGDFARHNADGKIEFIGRIDNQVKRNGVRIELEDVEAQITQFLGVSDCIAQLDENGSKLTAYVVTDTPKSLTINTLRQHAKTAIPTHMQPSRFVIVPSIPKTRSGKKDRAAFRIHASLLSQQDIPYIAPITSTERALAEIWQQVFAGQTKFGRMHDFQANGGDSLHHMMLILMIEKHFDISVSPGILGQITTLKLLAGQVDRLLAREKSAVNQMLVDSPLQPEIFQKQLRYVAEWQGHRENDHSLIVSSDDCGAKQQLFWCFQGGHELTALAEALAPDIRVHGMRSAYLLVDDVKSQITALASHYFNEIQTLHPTGSLLIGGNCQGGPIAHSLAELLLNAGREVTHLVLMEQANILPYSKSVGYIFGAESFLHPESRYENEAFSFQNLCDETYRQGYQLDTTRGGHGHFFDPINILSLAGCIRNQLLKNTFP